MFTLHGKHRFQMLSIVIASIVVLQLLAGMLPAPAQAASGVLVPEALTEQPGGSSKWVVAGDFQGWNPASEETRLKHLVGNYYMFSTVLTKGHHEFKLVKDGNWDLAISDGGNNFSIDLAEDTVVNFYVNEDLDDKARISISNVHGLKQYVPALSTGKWPRLVGDIQTVFDESAWSPETAKQFFVDYNFDNTVYKLQRTLPAGSYEAKVTFGPDWSENYGADGRDGANLAVMVPEATEATFSFDRSKLSVTLATKGFDGLIDSSSISFDSRSVTYKKPFGAIKQGREDLTLRIAAKQDDVQFAKVELSNSDSVSRTFPMHRVTTVKGQDYFEVTIPKTAFTKIGIWGYKFILVDGGTKIEYGDDSSRGAAGSVTGDGAVPYDLTVYDLNYKTPDWVKNAVIYQIFPDRFFDGNKHNNRAKTVDGVRGALSPEDATVKGGQKVQYFDDGVPSDPTPDQVWGDWETAPENPDRVLPENKPYYPDAKSDGAWTNEFYGGDIQGISKKLGYLKSLGITAIYLNPVSWAASNHKYDATDYEHLDPMFGEPVYTKPAHPESGLDYAKTRAKSDRIYQLFAKKAREQGLHLINDGVFNHVGDDSIYFDRYGKYPEIGAYEYWAKVYDKMAANRITQAEAEKAVRAEFTSKVNPLTGKNYKYPDDFEYITWFTVSPEKVKDRDGSNLHYKYDAWWGYDSLPAMDSKSPQTVPTDFFPADSKALPGEHEWNNIGLREQVIGHDLTGLSDADADKAMQKTNSQRWLWMGSSGWRLDVAPEVSAGTWKQFRKAVKSAAGRMDANGNPIEEPVLIGEEWGVATRYLLGDQFDSVMNYRFRGAVQDFIGSGNAERMNQALESIREDYPKEAWQAMMNLVDSHDTTRSVTKYDHPEWEEEHLKIAPAATDKALKQQALTAILQMGYPGAPTIYFGDEVGLEGTKDPDSRRAFPWDRIQESGDGSFSGAGRYQELFGTYQKAANLRGSADGEVFRTGELKVAFAKGDVIVYARKNDTKGGLVAINRGAGNAEIDAEVSGFLPDGLVLADRLGSGAQGTVTGGKIHLTVPAMSGMMMLSTTNIAAVPQVTGLQAAGGNGSVTLTWEAVAGADQYQVYRAAIEGGELQLIGSGVHGAAFTDTNVNNGTKYYYTVTAKIGLNESVPGDMASATPAFAIQAAEFVKQADDMTVGVGKITSKIQVSIRVPGLTDDTVYSGKPAPGLITRLIHYPSFLSPDQALETKLYYEADDAAVGSKIYSAAFEPKYAGAYRYEAQVSSDNGETFFKSQTVTVNVYADSDDTVPPAAPVLADINVESNLAHLRWELDNASPDTAGIEIYRNENGGDYALIATLGKEAKDYVDYTVSNDTAYTYKVTTFDMAYNRSDSAEKPVTPKLVMVDVTLRLHLPPYTPTTDDITIAGDFQGWNASSTKLHVPSGATDRSVVEYNFKIMAGKKIEYKYTRGSWSTEAFTSHARVENDTTDPGNWAYSSTDTNMKLTIANQGDNKQVVDDYVLRWLDMPMMVSLPRTSYGEDISYTTDESTMNLKAVVPFGVAFMINGKPIPEGAMDARGNVVLNNIPLAPGLNTFTLHIEPTAETLALPWYTDKGRADQATKTLTISVTRTS
ncbi:alpha-amylase family glycosyl hydrolase, partial [Paenibacillus beijingensis]|uniref:alpha-amylase family glycosyl hydrolase n=1 Tax=Paenibacillus beijingensis TaxID=1126833 RepID=UPI0005F0D242